MGCKYRVMDKCYAKDNIKDAFCFGKDGCPYYENEVEASPKDQYEARLKADMVAMLTDIQLEIEELKNDPTFCHHYKRGVNRSSDIIQQKIDELKEQKDEKSNS